MNQIVALAPGWRVASFTFVHTFDHGLPIIPEHSQGLPGHGALAQHFPNDGQLDERSRPAGTCDVSVPEPDELKKAVLPVLHSNLFVDPFVCARSEELRGDSDRFPAGFLCASRDGFHHAAIASAANHESFCRERGAERASLGITGISRARPGTAEDGHDSL